VFRKLNALALFSVPLLPITHFRVFTPVWPRHHEDATAICVFFTRILTALPEVSFRRSRAPGSNGTKSYLKQINSLRQRR
jgi:hypothetical protein